MKRSVCQKLGILVVISVWICALLPIAASANAGSFVFSDSSNTVLTGYTGPTYDHTVIIPEGVTEIADDAFANDIYNSYITGVSLPSTLEVIGDRAFSGCRITEITFPESLREIGSEAFSGNHIQSLYLPSTITYSDSINGGNGVFEGCMVQRVEFAEGITEIPSRLFANCSELKNVVLPSTLTTIKHQAFENCPISAITFPTSLTCIENGAFSGTSLKEMTVPVGMTLGSNAFSESSVKKVVFAEGITEISDAFYGCRNLTSVTLPSTLKTIGSNAFNGCSALPSIEIPDGVTTIKAGAFGGCSTLTSIDIPDSVTTIRGRAFMESGLTSITIPGSITEIGDGIIAECPNLRDVIIEDGVTSIGNYVFGRCTSLERITFPESMSTFESGGIFADANNLMVIKFLNRDPQFTRPDDFFGDYEPYRNGTADPTVYGYKGTQAETLAKKANLVFVPLEEETGETIKKEDAFNALDSVKVPTILVGQDQKGELTFEIDKNANKKNTIVYNVHLRNEYDGKPETLDEECILCFPYPEGLDENSLNKYRIVIHHYAGNGKTEIFKSEDGDIEFTKQGLCIRISSFSPFELAWENSSHLPKTGDSSRLGVWIALLALSAAAMRIFKRRIA